MKKLVRPPRARHGRRERPPGQSRSGLGRSRWPRPPESRARAAARLSGSAATPRGAGVMLGVRAASLCELQGTGHRAASLSCALGTLSGCTRFLSTTTLSPSVTMRSASEVDATIEAACAGDSHGAQTPVSAIGRGRWGRRRRVQARTAAASRSALHTFSTKSDGFVPITRRTSPRLTAVLSHI